jgi:hypothetical protein
MAQQRHFHWRQYCKQFLVSALEVLIQARAASFGNLNPLNPLRQV